MSDVFIVGSGMVGYSCIERCNPETRDHRPAPHYICPLANSYLCGNIPMCQLVNCGLNGKDYDVYKRK